MKIIAAVATAAIGLAGCVQTLGGAGQTKGGDPVAGSYSYDYSTQMFDFSVQSPRGWVCKSTFKRSGQNLQIRTVPLTCNDGRKGNLILTLNQIQQQAVGSFTLSNGESGQVTFGNT